MQSNLFTAVLLPLALAIVMLGMGLSLVTEDFRRITRYPKAVVIGTMCQVVLLPLIGLLIALVVPMQRTLAVGLIVLTVCPGGPSSNLMTYLAKGGRCPISDAHGTQQHFHRVYDSHFDKSGASAFSGAECSDPPANRTDNAANFPDHAAADGDRDGDSSPLSPHSASPRKANDSPGGGTASADYCAVAGA